MPGVAGHRARAPGTVRLCGNCAISVRKLCESRFSAERAPPATRRPGRRAVPARLRGARSSARTMSNDHRVREGTVRAYAAPRRRRVRGATRRSLPRPVRLARRGDRAAARPHPMPRLGVARGRRGDPRARVRRGGRVPLCRGPRDAGRRWERPAACVDGPPGARPPVPAFDDAPPCEVACPTPPPGRAEAAGLRTPSARSSPPRSPTICARPWSRSRASSSIFGPGPAAGGEPQHVGSSPPEPPR